MKILIVTFTFYPESNGVSEVATRQALEFARRGYETTVVCSPCESRKLTEFPSNVQIVEFGISGSEEAGFSGEIDEYQNFISTFECDVILLHCWHAWPLELAFAVLENNPAVKILVSHGYANHIWTPNPRFPWGLGAWLRRQPSVWKFRNKIQKIDHAVFLSSKTDLGRFFDHTLMGFLGFRNLSVIPNGASIGFLETSLVDFRGRFGIAKDEILVLNVANYSERKNQISALRAFAFAGIRGAVMVFIGSERNEYSAQLEMNFKALQKLHKGLRVLILDHLSKDLVFSAHNSADLFVLSAKAETQPLVLLDSMAAGVPFVSTDTGCVSELPGGLVVHSEKEMADAIKRLAGNPSLRKSLGEKGAAAVQKTYNWNANLERYAQLMQSLVARRKAC